MCAHHVEDVKINWPAGDRKNQVITKVISIHPLGINYIWNQFHGNLPNSLDMSALNMGGCPSLPPWIKPPDASNQEQLQHDDHGWKEKPPVVTLQQSIVDQNQLCKWQVTHCKGLVHSCLFFGLLIYSFAPTVTIIEKLWLMIKVKYSLLLVLMIYTYVQTVETEN